MSWLIPPRRFDPATPEHTERAAVDRNLLRGEMEALESINYRCGGHRLMVSYLERLIDSPPVTPLRILDLGTGAADIPRAIAAWARERQLPVEITAVDGNPIVAQWAREACADWPEIQIAELNILDLPYPAKSFDIVLCSLALHHFATADAGVVLQRIQEIARLGYVVNDLRRSWPAIALVDWLVAPVMRNPVTRHDARASSRAAFTMAELRELAQQAGMKNFQVARCFGLFRMVLAGRKEYTARKLTVEKS